MIHLTEGNVASDVWFADLVAASKEVDEEAREEERRTSRLLRSPVIRDAGAPHVFTADQRKRMDGYESIDYLEPQSLIYKDHLREVKSEPRWIKWAVYVGLGVAVGLWACLLFQTLDFLANTKRGLVESVVNSRNDALLDRNNTTEEHHLTPGGIRYDAFFFGYLVLLLWATVGCFLSSLCCWVMPTASGSGVPDVMAFLNGVMLPRIFNVRNLFFKTVSCILAVSSGLFGGVEGSMIHIGALIGAGLPAGRSKTLGFNVKWLSMFRNTKDHRDFVTAGAACGVTSAFSAPVGGLLFVMEEVATFLPVKLAWMIFVSTLGCICTMQLVNTYLQGWKYNALAPTNGDFADTAITMFRTAFLKFPATPLNLVTFIPTVVAGVLLGMLSVVFVIGNQRVNRFRSRWVNPNVKYRVLEPTAFVALLVTFCYGVPLAFPCAPIPSFIKQNGQTLGIELWTAFCSDRENTFHPLATLTLTSSYNVVRSLFVRNCSELFPWHSLLVYLAIYFFGAMYCGGIFTSIGTVMPTIVIGSTAGRLLGVAFEPLLETDPGVIALIGAASYFGGISRLTFSLVVIMMELTNDLTHVACLMLGIIIAKGVADQFCHSTYHSSLEMKCVPYLPIDSNLHKLDRFCAKDIMTANVVTLTTVDSFARIIEVMRTSTHNCFPVVSVADASRQYRGLLQRKQLELLVWHIYLRDSTLPGVSTSQLSTSSTQRHRHASYRDLEAVEEKIFWDHLPSLPDVALLPPETRCSFVDLNPYVDKSALYVRDVMCLSRTYLLFQNMGLRHLPVLNRHNDVVGILTRKNFVADRMRERLEATLKVAAAAVPQSPLKRE